LKLIIIIIIWIFSEAQIRKNNQKQIKRLSQVIWQVKEKCLKTLSEYRERQCRCHVWCHNGINVEDAGHSVDICKSSYSINSIVKHLQYNTCISIYSYSN